MRFAGQGGLLALIKFSLDGRKSSDSYFLSILLDFKHCFLSSQTCS